MKFEALNLKDTFKIWKLGLIVVLLGFSLVAIAFLVVEIPNYIESTSSSVWGYGYFHTSSNRNLLSNIISVAVLLPIVDIGLLIFIKLFSKWEKDAKGYGLSIDGIKVNVLCEGQSVNLEIKDVDRFEVLPKNCEPTLFKSKWTDVGYVVSNERTYKLYYLKNIQQAKNVFESNKSYQQG
ncbi:MAG: hypothetical protein IJ948_03735 [Clostridia bacterium]|nr:hypothetical protein [Clostridia bacterium]